MCEGEGECKGKCQFAPLEYKGHPMNPDVPTCTHCKFETSVLEPYCKDCLEVCHCCYKQRVNCKCRVKCPDGHVQEGNKKICLECVYARGKVTLRMIDLKRTDQIRDEAIAAALKDYADRVEYLRKDIKVYARERVVDLKRAEQVRDEAIAAAEQDYADRVEYLEEKIEEIKEQYTLGDDPKCLEGLKGTPGESSIQV